MIIAVHRLAASVIPRRRSPRAGSRRRSDHGDVGRRCAAGDGRNCAPVAEGWFTSPVGPRRRRSALRSRRWPKLRPGRRGPVHVAGRTTATSAGVAQPAMAETAPRSPRAGSRRRSDHGDVGRRCAAGDGRNCAPVADVRVASPAEFEVCPDSPRPPDSCQFLDRAAMRPCGHAAMRPWVERSSPARSAPNKVRLRRGCAAKRKASRGTAKGANPTHGIPASKADRTTALTAA